MAIRISQEIQAFIGSDIFPEFTKNGIKYFITITSQVSALTKMTVKTYSAKTGPHGIQLVELNSVIDAVNPANSSSVAAGSSTPIE